MGPARAGWGSLPLPIASEVGGVGQSSVGDVVKDSRLLTIITLPVPNTTRDGGIEKADGSRIARLTIGARRGRGEGMGGTTSATF